MLQQERTRIMLLAAIVLAAIAMTGLLLTSENSYNLADASCPLGYDWNVWMRATRDLFAGRNPYDTPPGCQMSYYNPVWTLLILAPFTLLPGYIGHTLWAIFNLFTLYFICRKFGQSKVDFILVTLSAPTFMSLAHGNIDIMSFLGIFLPLPLGLLVFAIKPQNSIGLVALLLYREYKEHGWKRILLDLMPVTVLMALNVAIYGVPHPVVFQPGFGVMFPWAVVPGLMLLYKAVRADDTGKAAATAPFLTPYAGINNTLGIMFAFKGFDLAIVSWMSWLMFYFYY